jgi:hypothetical protein
VFVIVITSSLGDKNAGLELTFNSASSKNSDYSLKVGKILEN